MPIKGSTSLNPAWNAVPARGNRSGIARTIKKTITYDMVGLLTGEVELFTPAVGDVILNIVYDIVTPWDGTTPKGDFGTYKNGATTGLALTQGVGYETYMDSESDAVPNPGLRTFYNNAQVYGLQYDYGNYITVTEAYPICACVSTTGKPDGADPGSTQGEANVYITVCTPAT